MKFSHYKLQRKGAKTCYHFVGLFYFIIVLCCYVTVVACKIIFNDREVQFTDHFIGQLRFGDLGSYSHGMKTVRMIL